MKLTVGIVGNPNCGKTTLFNLLTGAKQKVGNWPGVTVEKKTGSFETAQGEVEVIDLPGVYSMSASSPDEKIAQNFIFSGGADLIINILDASNIERNLYLTMQLLEMRVPLIIAANMVDIAKNRKIKLDLKKLAKELGCPVIKLVAHKREGVEQLKKAIFQVAENRTLPTREIVFPQEIESAIQKLVSIYQSSFQAKDEHLRWLAIKWLEKEMEPPQTEGEQNVLLSKIRERIEKILGEEIDIILADHRFETIRDIVDQGVIKASEVSQSRSDWIDTIVLNRFWGIPIFLFIMYLTFMITINVGGAFIDFFDQFVGTIMVDGFGKMLIHFGIPEWLSTLLANGGGGGVQTVATFIPTLFFMFLCLSILEDSGYMARAAFVMDRLMRYIGLPGKSIIPMMVGFGCNVPAIMATRTLENERDRTLTVMMVPFMSCGARLPIYALFAAAFFPRQGQNLVFSLYLVGIFMAILTGFLLRNTAFKGPSSSFVMELPPYHIPRVKGTLLHTWERLKGFMIRAGKVIIGIVIVLSFLNSFGMDGTFGHEESKNSVLSQIGKTITPLFEPMGIQEENWPATVGIFTGIFAKEAVVGTLDALYATLDTENTSTEEKPFDFWNRIQGALATIPEGLSGVRDKFTDPLGMNIGEISERETAATEQEVAQTTFGAMVTRFDGKAGALAYLLFILLYFPCVAATATVYRETNRFWTIFIVTYLTVLAWSIATAFYQIATFSQHPADSIGWLTGIIAGGVLFVLTLSHLGKKMEKMERSILFIDQCGGCAHPSCQINCGIID